MFLHIFVLSHPAGAASIPADCTRATIGARSILDKLIAFTPVVVVRRLLSLTLAGNLFPIAAARSGAMLTERMAGDVLLVTHGHRL